MFSSAAGTGCALLNVAIEPIYMQQHRKRSLDLFKMVISEKIRGSNGKPKR